MATERDVILTLKGDTTGLDQALGKTAGELQTINQQLTGIEDELRNLSKEASKGEAAKAFNKLNGIIEKNVLSIQELGVAADNFKNIALAAGTTSPIGQEALKRAAQMENEMDKLNQSVAQLAEGGRNLNAAMQLGTGVIAGYSAFQGVTALLGTENEDLQKTFVKLQAAQAILMGTKELSIALSKKGILATTAEAEATGVLKIATTAYNAVIGTSTGLMKAFKIAMISTGIGALVVGIGLLIANFDTVSKWVKKVIVYFSDLKNVLLALLGPIGWIIMAYQALQKTEESAADKRARLHKENVSQHQERLKQIEDEKNKKLAAIDSEIKALQLTKETLEAQGKSSYKVTLDILEHEKMKLQAVLEANNAKIQSWIDYYQRERELSGLSDEDYAKQMKGRGVDFEALQQQAIALTQDTQDAIQRSENEITALKRGEYEKQKGALDKKLADEKKAIEDQMKLQMELERQITDFRLANMQDGAEKELAILREKQKREREALIAKYGEDAELIKELETKQFNELEALFDKFDNERLAKEQQFQKELIDLRLSNMKDGRDKELASLREKHRLELEELREKYGAETELEKELLLQQKQQLKEVNDEFDEQDRQEKIAKAQETLDTIQGLMDAANEINSLLNELGQQERDKITARRDEDLSALEKNKKAQLKTEGLTAAQKANIEFTFAMQAYNIKKKAAEAEDKIAEKKFKRNKALKLAQIAIDTASGIMQAVATFGPPPSPLGIAGIAAAGVIGGLQAAVVARTQFQGSSGSISPPDFGDFAVADSGGAGGSGGANGNQTGSQQNNTTTNTDSLINGGGSSKVILSMVELNEMQNEMNQIKAVSSIGGG